MFTQISDIQAVLEAKQIKVDSIRFITQGVMTDKYHVHCGSEEYIVRCYPPSREWLAETEFRYLQLLRACQVLVPRPIFYQMEGIPLLLYERLQGDTLRNRYNTIPQMERQRLLDEIVDNYQKVSRVSTLGAGRSKGYDSWTNATWIEFLDCEIGKTRDVALQTNDTKVVKVCDGMQAFLPRISEIKQLVWSDFSMDNIIISPNGHLAGFIDWEGLMAGDPLLGVGYLLAHETTTFAEDIMKYPEYKKHRQIINFYAVLRYIRLYPYLKEALPNGTPRDPIENYLSYSVKHLIDFYE